MKKIIIEELMTIRSSRSFSTLLNEVKSCKTLSVKEEREIFQIIKGGGRAAERAKDKLARHNIKMVVTIAKNYCLFGLPIEELVAYGNVGLAESINSFDVDKNKRFSSYATRRIQGCIIDGLNEMVNQIRLPKAYCEELSRYRMMCERWQQMFQRNISVEEYVLMSGVEERVMNNLLRIGMGCESLDRKLNSDEDFCLADLQCGDIETDGAVKVEFELRQVAEHITRILTPKELMLIEDLSVMDNGMMSIQDISRKRRMKVGDIRRFLKNALAKIKSEHTYGKIASILFNYNIKVRC